MTMTNNNWPMARHRDPTGTPPKLQRVVMLSDIHDRYDKLFSVPEGDILLIAGDLTFRGDQEELERCNEWLDQQESFKHKIVIPGNHDLTFETKWDWACKQLPAADAILNQNLYIADGLSIWGEPRQPWFYDWAYNVSRDRMKKDVWDQVPSNIDILLTHGPPWGVGDQSSRGKHVGCKAQREWILQHQPRLVVCGHIHEGYGIYLLGNTVVVNASTCNSKYQAVNPPIVLDL